MGGREGAALARAREALKQIIDGDLGRGCRRGPNSCECTRVRHLTNQEIAQQALDEIELMEMEVDDA